MWCKCYPDLPQTAKSFLCQILHRLTVFLHTSYNGFSQSWTQLPNWSTQVTPPFTIDIGWKHLSTSSLNLLYWI